ncbi:MAG: hypothetical protein DI549_16585 [Ancylobacter novellus]|uniref:Uncharacterized protein n=1 Tax=Ancylobacter novellus TaxID=921 RepID=A0A2W5QWK9_ANCNO|nr:MAG: hypothetical protein DI549_16585 [Ancylobacter novellus]
MPWVDTEKLEAIETLAMLRQGDRVAELHRQMLQDLTTTGALTDEDNQKAFRQIYDEAVAIALPATMAYLRHAQEINALTRSHSLSTVDLKTLKEIDGLGHNDPAFGKFVADLVAKLGPKTKTFDVIAYSQFFEIYGEAITLQYLRSRPGLQAGRVEESTVGGEGRPDFICRFDDGQTFYVEVKSLDIVGGEFRHREMMNDALDVQAELDDHRKEGRRVIFAEGTIAPYKTFGQTTGYDCRSLNLVIDTLRGKCRSAFKSSQFELGPTFALAVVDRLIVPGGRNALAPYYYDSFNSGCCVSGVLWHVAYGRIGTPIFRSPDFEGMPTLEAHLTTDGLYSDENQPFHGEGLIVLDTHGDRRVAYGLASPSVSPEPWSRDRAETALGLICDAQNDIGNSSAYLLSDARTT